LGDRSFIDASARGIEKANKELPVKCDIIETNGVSEHETALRGAIAQNYDLVLGLAMDPEMFVSLAKEFPDQKFASPSELFLDSLPPGGKASYGGGDALIHVKDRPPADDPMSHLRSPATAT